MSRAEEALLDVFRSMGLKDEQGTVIAAHILELHRKEIARKLLDVEHWIGAEHLAKSSIRTYKAVAGRAVKNL